MFFYNCEQSETKNLTISSEQKILSLIILKCIWSTFEIIMLFCLLKKEEVMNQMKIFSDNHHFFHGKYKISCSLL
jgi:hypothetical protein